MNDTADFTGREELFRAVADWWENGGERYFLLGGGVGTGKTTAMARLVSREAPVVAGHFCEPGDLSTRNPVEAARSLSTQLASQVAGFTEALVGLDGPRSTTHVQGTGITDEVGPGGVNAGVYIATLVVEAPSDEAAWQRTVTGPLRELSSEGLLPPLLIAVDALDEAELYDGRTKLTDLVLGTGSRLPQVRWLVSTRYPESVAGRLPERDVRRWDLSYGPGGAETTKDVRAFLVSELGLRDGPVLDLAEGRTGGNFLHARLLVETVRARGRPEPDLVVAVLEDVPPDLDGSQSGYLRQIVGSDGKVGWLDGYHPVVSALVAAREPLDLPTLVRLGDIPSSVAVHVLARIGPLLAPEGTHAPGQRYSLHHAQFREFLVDPARATTWWCDPEEAEQRIMRAYDKQTRGWSQWRSLDSYGTRHLYGHARRAGWTAADFDRLVVPGYAARLAEEPDAAAAVLRALDVPIAVAVAEPDVPRAFFWSWTARRIRGALLELLGVGTPALLVRAGHEDLAVASLSLTARTEQHGDRFDQMVAALAGERLWADVRTVMSLAPPSERPRLLLRAAAVRAQSDPEDAWTMVGEALASASGSCRHHLLADHRTEDVWTELAAVPALADRTRELADGRAELLNAVTAGLTRWDPRRAVDLAPELYLTARGAAYEMLARSDPAEAVRLLGRLPAGDGNRTRILYTLLLDGQLPPHLAPRWTADRDGPADPVRLLLAAALSHAPDDPELTSAARRLDEGLSPAAAAPAGGGEGLPDGWARDLADLDLAPLRRDPVAASIGAAVVFRALRAAYVDDDGHDGKGPDAHVAGRLGAALAILVPETADRLMAAATPGASAYRSAFLEALVGRLCPVDPERAWRTAEESHDAGALRAWAQFLPASQIAEGTRKVARIDARFSGTRAAMAGLLAAKLPRDDGDRARELLRLTSSLTDGAVYRQEHTMLSTAFAGAAPAEDDLSAALLRRIDFLPPHRARTNLPDPPAGGGLPAVADHVAARASHTGIAVLAATAAQLSREAEPGPREAGELLRACLDPRLVDTSVYVPAWPAVARAVRQAYLCWHDRLRHPLDGFLHTVRHHLDDGQTFLTAGLLLASLPPQDRERTVDFVQERLPGAGRALERVLMAYEGHPPPGFWQRLIARASEDRWRLWTAEMALRVLAGTRPRAALDLLRDVPEDRLATAFGTRREALLVDLAPAVAKSDRDLAVSVADDMRRRDPEDAAGCRALHAIALTVADEDWDGGLRISRDIDLPQARGPALGALAHAATGLSSPDERRRAYTAVVEEAEAGLGAAGCDPVVRRGLLTALSADPEWHPDVVARLIPSGMAYHDAYDVGQLASLVELVARDSSARDFAPSALRSAESFLVAAWRL
ncbi:hypothetical protein JCM4814A_58830 [Streptomyces phaeofaciens JCM 4814]|uniref:Nephrocystin 3-like N-terminal domain-containing protein n=1 Tax=Streptomyces phaeofaciens TaxID=68254 RepID=A0A918HMX8_9ACTN|nr:hypothetical protein [Streptomyces phaeofaciens]GGT78617.1 hypothetical protein GCM10010226_66040 [Streptomyces phaeofaciens]